MAASATATLAAFACAHDDVASRRRPGQYVLALCLALLDLAMVMSERVAPGVCKARSVSINMHGAAGRQNKTTYNSCMMTAGVLFMCGVHAC